MNRPVVHLRGICRTYRGHNPVRALNGVDVQFDSGQVTAIVGRSGSGKSTLLHVLGLLDRPDAGAYLLDDRDVSDISERERSKIRASAIGFVFQQFHLIPYRTAAENVELALQPTSLDRADRVERARQTLARVGLAQRTDHYPAQLSGGEQQRVSLARALVSDPVLLLCDEPTGNLDSHTADNVMELIVALREHSRTIVIVTHDASIADRADRLYTMVDGRLVPGRQP